jgi:uncharacterized protein YjiK
MSRRVSTVRPFHFLYALPLSLTLVVTLVGAARAQLVVAGQFDPSGVGSLCGLAFDSQANEVWVHGCFGADIRRYSATGTFLSSVPPAGESANDVDIEVAASSFTLGATQLPKHSLLQINGETGVADVYAIDKTTGAVLSTLNTSFGASHVVGGAHHRTRASLFVIQDRVPAASVANRVAELSPQTGAVLNTFQIAATFDVNFGDLEVCNATGNLLVVSSDEPRIAEYTPTGTLVQYHPLPVGVSSLSGIALDETQGEIWVASSAAAGQVWRLSGGTCAPTPVPALAGRAPVALALLLLVVAWSALGARRGAPSGHAARARR